MPKVTNQRLRTLRADDIPTAFGLSAQAGWNQSEEDWRLLLELSPEGCLGIEVDGQLVATTTLFCYGRRLAWIGMVLTRSDYRRRGLARKLLASCLERADQMGIETTKLDATDQGQPLYEKFGFREISYEEMPRYFQRISKLVGLAATLAHREERLLVMKLQ